MATSETTYKHESPAQRGRGTRCSMRYCGWSSGFQVVEHGRFFVEECENFCGLRMISRDNDCKVFFGACLFTTFHELGDFQFKVLFCLSLHPLLFFPHLSTLFFQFTLAGLCTTEPLSDFLRSPMSVNRCFCFHNTESLVSGRKSRHNLWNGQKKWRKTHRTPRAINHNPHTIPRRHLRCVACMSPFRPRLIEIICENHESRFCL